MLGSRVRALRRERGLTQEQLAALAGVSRQMVGAVEAGRHLPRVDAAVALAGVLGTSVEELLEAPPLRSPDVVGVVEEPREGTLVRLGRVGDQLVCVPGSFSGESWPAADAVVRGPGVELLDTERPAAVIVGCEPAIGLAARLLEGEAGPRVLPVPASSAAAVVALGRGRAHAVVVHGPVGTLPSPSLPVRRLRMARWQVGLAAEVERSGGWPADALAGRVAVVQREEGAGSQAAFERALSSRGESLHVRGPRAAGHVEAAWRAATDGLVAVTIEPSALAMGLAFWPLEAHESELWVASEHLGETAVAGLVDELTGPRLRRRLEAIGGYDLSAYGAEVSP